MPISMAEVIKDALLDLGVVRVNETPAKDVASFVLGRFNRILNDWNAIDRGVYSTDYLTFELVPSLSPHTIGSSSATFTVDVRPVEIIGINVLLADTSPTVRSPVTQHDSEWYFGLPVPLIETTYPTDFFYDPSWPNGSIYFWPVPTGDNEVVLEVRKILAEVSITDLFDMPPGYQSALTLTLEEDIAPALGKRLEERIAIAATKARARIFDINDKTPALTTWDSGMPSGNQRVPTFNYRTGLGR